MTDERSNTTPKQQGGVTGKGFVKGDPRINRNGRPRKFDQLQNLAQSIAHEVAIGRDGLPIAINGHTVTVTEAILRQWARDPKQQELFMRYAFGNIPQRQEITGADGDVIRVKVTNDD